MLSLLVPQLLPTSTQYLPGCITVKVESLVIVFIQLSEVNPPVAFNTNESFSSMQVLLPSDKEAGFFQTFT